MCYEEMSKTMPPVAGLAQGAMVLEDSMFEGLTFENLTKVLDPKVTGTQLLDELFYDAPLEFFVVMSSLTSIVGNSGQSNYTAANMFMVALAEQRRQRGVAGSSIAISSLIGIGYVERSENFSSDYFENIGYRNISEQDLHQLFAEAILVGRPGCTESSEIATGLQPFYPERNSKAQFFDDIRFDHFILEHQEVQDYGGKLSAMPIRVQLAEAKTKDEAYAIVKGEILCKRFLTFGKSDFMTDGFSLRLKRTLMISQDDTINEKASLIEQGIDSLMAVEVRTWFLKELDVDIPVLRILGGSSITDLLADAMERVPVSVLDFNALSSNTKPAEDETPKQATSSRITSKVQENPTNSSDTGSKSTSSASTSTSAEPSRTPVIEMELSVEDISKIKVEEKLLEAVPKTQLVSGKEEIHEMSYGQARFWFLSGYLTNKKSFNMSVMFKLTGKLQVDRLEKAVETIAQRQALRTRYFWSGEGDQRVPMQGILSEPTMRIGSDADAKDELRKIHDHTWDLNSWEAAKMKLFSISDNEHYFLVSGHHISWDGYAFSVLFIDLDAAYAGRQLPPLGVESQYRSFAAWQRNTYKQTC
jgi:hybrid polyketide synthase/nonribosomal peptide synthetase ACE1